MEVFVLLCHYKGMYALAEGYRKELQGQAVTVVSWGSTHKLGTGYVALHWMGQAPAAFAQSLDNDPRIYEYATYPVNQKRQA